MISHDSGGHADPITRVGELIGGRYRLESVIGYGALGTVMRARHITMGREVAVKILRPDISTHPAIRRRLIQRVHAAQNLYHPSNCRLFDFGQTEGSLYLVMELLHGAPLRTIIERGAPYSVGWVLDIGLQILDGLGEAHDLDIVHRNLKPRNIYLLPRRRGGQQVKIMDYGLASSLDALPGEDPDDDREAEICGTAAYLAPETLVQQKSGKPTDVYAVALILLEMLTGQQVFRGDTLSQVLYRQIHTSVRLPAKLAWTSLGKCLLKALSKHPDNRFADADAFYEALEHAAQTTATYFRLDPSDLDPLDESMPPELLARMMRNQRARQKSERGGDGGGDEDSDDSEPGPPAHRAPPGSDFLGDSGSLGGSDFLGESDFPGKPEADDSALPDNKPSAPAESTSWAFLPHFELGASPLVPPPFPLPNSPSGKRAAPPRPGLRSAEQPPAGIASGDGDEDAAAFARARFPRAGDPPDKVRHADSDSGADDAQRDEADHDAADLQNAPAQDGDERIDADWVTRGGIALVTLLFVLAALGVYMTASWA